MKEGKGGKVEKVEEKEKKGQFRVLFDRYGFVGIGTYFTVYVSTLASLTVLLKSSLFSPTDAIDLLNYLGINRLVNVEDIHPDAGNFAVAWILTKFTEPLRLALTIAITPGIARWVGRAPPKEEKKKN